MPIVWGRADRIMNKLAGWKQNTLSQAGKEVLIKAVINAISNYTMSCLLLPKGWCQDINKLVANFW